MEFDADLLLWWEWRREIGRLRVSSRGVENMRSKKSQSPIFSISYRREKRKNESVSTGLQINTQEHEQDTSEREREGER